jgi:hypothetical protein
MSYDLLFALIATSHVIFISTIHMWVLNTATTDLARRGRATRQLLWNTVAPRSVTIQGITQTNTTSCALRP